MSTKVELVGVVAGVITEAATAPEFNLAEPEQVTALATVIVEKLDDLEALNYTDEAETQDAEEPVEA
jgi:hypothetical protein